ncbi:DUF3857 domain-containing protein [Formosa haliotis]|uniref:DUF3857 domain-containing protein n=1 Tax=Formosa haliotis TaxID=1555194 RepID=UPI00082550FD|nr:DUF3857 domain-containing transglutaminase family protein [Formosa haliotis]
MKLLPNLLCILAIQVCFAQDYRFGKVSKEELEETANAKDPEAHATILYANEDVTFKYEKNKGFTVVTEVQKRIKIYDKEGVKWATESVAFFDPDNSSKGEKLKGLKGYTYSLENGKIEDVKLDKDNVFDEATNKYWKQVKFTMPNISDGCIVEFQYRKESPYLSIDNQVLQYDIPVKKLDFRVSIPEYFHFNKYINPKASYFPTIKESKKNRTESLSSKTRTKEGGGFSNVVTTYDSSQWDFVETVYEASLTDIPALKPEPFVDNLDIYRSEINWEYAMYKGPDGEIKKYSTNWESVTKTIYEHEDFGGQLAKSGYFEADIDKLLANVTNQEERIDLVYNFVKSKVAWNEFYGNYTENGVKKAYKEGIGNVADINLMLTAMLRYAGISANPVLVSTKSNGVPLYPTRQGFNYVISAVELKDKLILLDATYKYAMPNILPSRALNWQGRIVREHGSSAWVSLLDQPIAEEACTLQVKLQTDLTAEGRVLDKLTNANAMNFRSRYNNMGNDERLRAIESGKGEIEISNYEIKNMDNLNEPNIQYSYTFKLNSAAEQIGDQIYVSPMLFFTNSENIFKQEERLYPIEFNHPRSYTYKVSVMLPEGYKVESLPESARFQFKGGEGDFSFMSSSNSNMVAFRVNYSLANTFVITDDYEHFKTFFGMMVEKETEKMVLTKISTGGTE